MAATGYAEKGYAEKADEWESEDLAALSKEAHDPYDLDDTDRLQVEHDRTERRQATERLHTWHLSVVGRSVTAYRHRVIFRRTDSEVAREFASLANEWRAATAFESNLSHLVANISYQRIIGLGPQVLALILGDLQETHDQWFWALFAIVGEDKAAGLTQVGDAVDAWLAWGREVGLVQ